MVNVDPPSNLPDHHTSEFRSAYRECIIPKNRGFDREEYRTDLDNFIDQEREHRRLINFCVFPFVESSPEGYQFVRADPLEECNVKNFDFLLHDLEGKVIFGEAKASLPTNVDSVINDVIDQREKVEKLKEYVEKNYLGQQMVFDEYVLATYDNYDMDASRKILARGEDVKVWGVNRTEKELNLKKSLPNDTPDNIPGEDPIAELSQLANHSVGRLNSELENRETATGAVNVLPKSADIDKLRVITRAYSSEGRDTFINRSDIRREIKAGARNYGAERIDEITDELIELGEDIGLLREWEDRSANYRVISQYTSRSGIEKTLKNKWKKHRISERYSGMQEECRKYAQEKVGEQALVKADRLIPLSDDIDFVDAAALPVAYMTAFRMLKRAEVGAGDLVFVPGATGGIGTATVQLSDLLGAHSIGTSSSAQKLENLKRIGADHTIESSNPETIQSAVRDIGRVDVTINHLGGPFSDIGLSVLRRGGRMVVCGQTAGPTSELTLGDLFLNQKEIVGSTMGTQPDLKRLVDLASAGDLDPVVHETYDLYEADQAFADMSDRSGFGKLVVTP